MTTHTHAETNPWAARTAVRSWEGIGMLTWKAFLKLVANPAMFGFALILPIFLYMMFGAGQEYSKEWAVNANVGATVLVSMTLYGVMIAGASAATVVALVVIAVTYGVGYATGARMTPAAWIQSALIVLAAAMMSATLGLALGFLLRSDTSFAVINGVVVLGAFLAGMFIPIDSMGSFFKSIAPGSPFYGIFYLSQLPLYGFDSFKWTWVISAAAWFIPFVVLAVWAQHRDTDR